MKPFSLRISGAFALVLSQFVPIVACSSDDESDGDDEIREHNDCQVAVDCDASRFVPSEPLAPGTYELSVLYEGVEVECSFEVSEDETISGSCVDEESLALDVEALEIALGRGDMQLTLTDENGCSATASVSANDHDVSVEGCDAICTGALSELDVSACAEDWEKLEEPDVCETGHTLDSLGYCDWTEASVMIFEGCGYRWFYITNLDTRVQMIVDEEGTLVFQEVSDPLSTTNPQGCRGGTIPSCGSSPNWPLDLPPISLEMFTYTMEEACAIDLTRPVCETGHEAPVVCADPDPLSGSRTIYLEGCGYTWVRVQHADSQRDTIVDENDVVVFQEWSDPLSTGNPAGCIGGEIPECEEFPAPEDRWRDDAFSSECPVDGMGGAGGMGGGPSTQSR